MNHQNLRKYKKYCVRLFTNYGPNSQMNLQKYLKKIVTFKAQHFREFIKKESDVFFSIQLQSTISSYCFTYIQFYKIFIHESDKKSTDRKRTTTHNSPLKTTKEY